MAFFIINSKCIILEGLRSVASVVHQFHCSAVVMLLVRILQAFIVAQSLNFSIVHEA